MLTFSRLNDESIGVNPMHVHTVLKQERGTRLEFAEGRYVVVAEPFDDVMRKLRGALLTKEIHA